MGSDSETPWMPPDLTLRLDAPTTRAHRSLEIASRFPQQPPRNDPLPHGKRQLHQALVTAHALLDTGAPLSGVAAFEVFLRGRFWTFGETLANGHRLCRSPTATKSRRRTTPCANRSVSMRMGFWRGTGCSFGEGQECTARLRAGERVGCGGATHCDRVCAQAATVHLESMPVSKSRKRSGALRSVSTRLRSESGRCRH